LHNILIQYICKINPLTAIINCLITISVMMFFAFSGQGQNLIPNPCFETVAPCPAAQSGISNAAPWQNPTGSITSTDLFHACNGSVGTGCGNVSVPDNFTGNTPAFSGDGYVGIMGYYTACPNCREYAEVELVTPLVAGVTYDIGFYVRPAELNRYFIDLIGMNIQVGAHNQAVNQPILLTPTLESGYIDDVTVWTLISGTYTAVGGEDHLAIGVFRDNADLNIFDTGGSTSGCALVASAAFYLVDDPFIVESGSGLQITGDTIICPGNQATLVTSAISCSDLIWTELGSPIVLTNADTLLVSPVVTTSYVASAGSGGSDTIIVQVVPPPVVDLGPDTTICVGALITLDTGIPGATYLWSTTETTQTIQAGTEGQHWVQVTVGGCVGSDTMNIIHGAVAPIDLGNDTVICQGQSILLDAGTGGAGYFWSTIQTSQTINVSAAGEYWVIADFNGCIGRDTINVSVESFQVNIPPNGLICEGETLTINATAIGATSYTWSNGSTDPSTTIQTGGQHWVEASSANCTSSDSINVLLIPRMVDIEFQDTLLCIGESVSFDVTHPNAQAYLWSDGTSDPTNQFDSTGTYWIQVSNTLCVFRDTMNVRVSDPLAAFDISDTAFCVPSSVQFDDESITNLPSDPINYWYWNFGTGIEAAAQDPSHTYDQSGDYEIGLLVRTVSGCEDDTIHSTSIHGYQNPVADFSFTPQQPDPINPVVRFEDNSLNSHVLFWQFGNGVTSNEINPAHLYEDAGVYTVIQWVTSLQGCLDSASYRVRIEDPYFIYVPNSFTPNNDGINEVFKAEGEGVLEFTFEIHNRWGEMIWQTGDIANSWDGTYKGLPVEGGVYVYQIELTTVNLDPISLYGKVVVLK
jgi:gliding motility-associated-like protein